MDEFKSGSLQANGIEIHFVERGYDTNGEENYAVIAVLCKVSETDDVSTKDFFTSLQNSYESQGEINPDILFATLNLNR